MPTTREQKSKERVVRRCGPTASCLQRRTARGDSCPTNSAATHVLARARMGVVLRKDRHAMWLSILRERLAHLEAQTMRTQAVPKELPHQHQVSEVSTVKRTQIQTASSGVIATKNDGPGSDECAVAVTRRACV